MPRPDLTEERSSQILDAFERCLVKFGLEGSSLESVAEEAGVKRSLIRHYLGNRDHLIDAMGQRAMARYRAEVKEMIDLLPEKGRIDRLLAHLFPAQAWESAEETLLFDTLLASADRYPRLRKQVASFIEDYIEQLAHQLELAYPDAAPRRCRAVAFGILSISFNHESLRPLKLPEAYRKAARESAEALVATLEG